MTTCALSLDRVVVQLGGNRVLNELSLAADPSAITAVLGPNGAGKTTMIRACTRLQTVSSGKIEIFGEPIGRGASFSHLGLMPQATGAWSGVRPGELLEYLARFYSAPIPPRQLLAYLGIDTFAKVPYRRLSVGQQQLVNLAGAIIGRPRLVFLDEPTAGLDPHIRRTVWGLIDELRAASVAVILTTHNMDEAAQLADYVYLLNVGTVVASGTVAELTTAQSLEELFLSKTQPKPTAP